MQGTWNSWGTALGSAAAAAVLFAGTAGAARFDDPGAAQEQSIQQHIRTLFGFGKPVPVSATSASFTAPATRPSTSPSGSGCASSPTRQARSRT